MSYKQRQYQTLAQYKFILKLPLQHILPISHRTFWMRVFSVAGQLNVIPAKTQKLLSDVRGSMGQNQISNLFLHALWMLKWNAIWGI